MRDFSKVSPSLWKSKKFRALPDDAARLVYVYLLTCPHGNSAGCFDLDPAYACTDLRMPEKAYRKAIESLKSVGLVDFDSIENTIYLVNWATFNEPTNAKHAIGLLTQLNQASCVRLKVKALADFEEVIHTKGFDNLEALRKTIDSLTIDYREGILNEKEAIERVSPPRPDRDRDRDLEGDVKSRPSSKKDMFDEVVAFWNSTAKAQNLPQVQSLTPARRTALALRIQEAGSIEAFKAVIAKVVASNFCRGMNDRAWKADFDFVLKQSSFVKIMEGKYDNPPSGNGHTADVNEADWDERLIVARRMKSWDKRWGPFPNAPGCIVPQSLVQPMDGQDWSVWESKK